MLPLLVGPMLWCIAPGVQAAERELHWDALTVEAHLEAGGCWKSSNGTPWYSQATGTAVNACLTSRPRQKLEFLGLERMDVKDRFAAGRCRRHPYRTTSTTSPGQTAGRFDGAAGCPLIRRLRTRS